MFPSRAFTNAPWAPRNASCYHPSSVQAFQATANVQPASVSVSIVAAPPTPAPTAVAAPAPILNSFSAKPVAAAPIAKAEPTAIPAIASMTCVKDSQVVHAETMAGLGKGILKGALTGEPSKIITSGVSGYVVGNLKGNLMAAETCIPTLPRNVPPKP